MKDFAAIAGFTREPSQPRSTLPERTLLAAGMDVQAPLVLIRNRLSWREGSAGASHVLACFSQQCSRNPALCAPNQIAQRPDAQ
jgi:hypothetical protein